MPWCDLQFMAVAGMHKKRQFTPLTVAQMVAELREEMATGREVKADPYEVSINPLLESYDGAPRNQISSRV